MNDTQTLPDAYRTLAKEELAERIARRKEHFGRSLCILAHHYQHDDVYRFADFTGDSLKLSQLAAEQKEAKYIVFCGVHFMAESADVLTGADQIVCLPNMLAGCNMADMAEDAAFETALREMAALAGERIVPIAYVNSSAAIKAATARAGGACCTSSNVRNVFEWAFRPEAQGGAGAGKILAVPDQHLARNTAIAMGFSTDECALYDPDLPDGGLTAEAVRRAKFILWNGHCYVHRFFQPRHVEAVRRRYPEGITVIVHPECPQEVVRMADASGSTEQIIRAVAAGAPGSRWAVGTESNMVNRLARQHGDRFIRVLSDTPSICAMMARIDMPHLLWVLDSLAEGKVVNRVSVPADIATDARVALQRMIDIKAVQDVTRPA